MRLYFSVDKATESMQNLRSLRVLTGMWGLNLFTQALCGTARTPYPACGGSHFSQERREEGCVSHFYMTSTSSLQTSNCVAENMLVEVSQSSLVLNIVVPCGDPHTRHHNQLLWSLGGLTLRLWCVVLNRVYSSISLQLHQLNTHFLFYTYLYHVSPACFGVSHIIFRENLCVPYSKTLAFMHLLYMVQLLHHKI